MRKLFFELVQVSVGQLDGMSRFPEPDEWRKLFELSRRHAIAGICYHGITSLQEHGLVAPQELSRDWLKEVEQEQKTDKTSRGITNAPLALIYYNRTWIGTFLRP